MSQPSLTIRPLTTADAEAAAMLSAELGYPVGVEEMRERVLAIEALPDHAVFAAVIADSVVGWIDVGTIHHLQSGAFGEIGGLVVASAVRSRGVGRFLLQHAEGWLKERGITEVVVRSRSTRVDAHRFYLREGYRQTKTSAVFSKTLAERCAPSEN